MQRFQVILANSEAHIVVSDSKKGALKLATKSYPSNQKPLSKSIVALANPGQK
jgi:hypothetical protein